MRNPLARARRKEDGHDADWLKYASDQEIDILFMFIDEDVPILAETARLYRDIQARALRRMRRDRSASAVEARLSDAAPTDFATWLSERWEAADGAARDALRTIASALGMEPPADPPVKMRRTRPPDSAAERLAATQQPSCDVGTIGQQTNAGARSKGKRAGRVRHPQADDYWTKGEGAWGDDAGLNPCASLFQALHPENRGWD